MNRCVVSHTSPNQPDALMRPVERENATATRCRVAPVRRAADENIPVAKLAKSFGRHRESLRFCSFLLCLFVRQN